MALTVLEKIKRLKKRNYENSFAVNKDLYRLLCQKELLFTAARILNLNKANLEGLPEKDIVGIIKNLKTQSFEFRPVKNIRRQKKTETLRPLSIHDLTGKVVEKAMLIILESIYEPTFYDSSHGFRPGKTHHTALRDIRHWSSIEWVIEGKMQRCSEQMDHHILISILRLKIQDERFLNLIWKFLRSDVNEHGILKSGIPQGCLLSPMLVNIYLNELDKFISVLSKEFNNATQSKNLESVGLNPILKNCIEQLRIIARDSFHTSFCRVRFVRYFDGWIVGVVGRKAFAEGIQTAINLFLLTKLKLDFSTEKSHILYFHSHKVDFLGFCIQISKYSPKSKLYGELKVNIPTEKLVKRLAEENFCTNLGRGIRKKGWIRYSDKVITLKYNRVLQGLRNYYWSADNYDSSFKRIEHIIYFSWAHTLAGKHRTRISKQLKRKKSLGLNLIFF